MHKRHRSYSRWLVACVAVAVALFLANSASAAEVQLAWDPNSEDDLAGYGVYYQKFPTNRQYDFFGYVALEEFSDSGSPTFTVSGLDPGSQYQFAVTAYDSDGNESTFSIPVCADIGSTISVITCPSNEADGGGDGGGGGGGGGGCFIGVLSGAYEGWGGVWTCSLLTSLLALITGRKRRSE